MYEIAIKVTREELAMLEEAVCFLMPIKRGARLTRLLKLRTKIAQELAMAIEQEEADGR